jgi:RNA polymerase sigma factor (sigma-70 family)
MGAGRLRDLLHQFRRATVSDAAGLLERFLADRDEEAFASLVERYGPLVLGVCRRVLHNADDAEDAFQATFLILARKAASISKRSSLASWLHGVAHRVALRARSNLARRRVRERQAAQMESVFPADPTWSELRPILDEEIGRLPERHRAPFVLCYLEGKTYEEAAHELGWPKGTVATRLAQARQRLRRRLTHRGLTLSAPLLAAALTEPGHAAVPPALGLVSVRAITLAEGVLHAMHLSKVKTRLALLLVLSLLGGSAVLAGRNHPAAVPASRAPVARSVSATEALPRGAVARLGSPLLRHAGASTLAFSADGNKLVSAGAGSEIRVWDVRSRKELWRGRGEGKETLGAAFSADGKTLFTVGGAGPGAVCVWDVATGKHLRRFPQPPEYLFGVAFSADRKTAALLLGSNQVRVVNLQTGKERRTLPPGDDITPLAFSPDGTVLACRGRAIELRDADTGKRRAEFGKMPARPHALSFSPDGAMLAAALGDGTMRLLDVAAGKEVQRLAAAQAGARILVAISSRGVVATASSSPSADGQPAAVRLWDLKGKELRQLATSRYLVAALAFSADGKTLAATGLEGIIHLWEVATGKPLSHTAGHQGAVIGALFAPNGKTVVTRGEDRTLRLWDTTSGRELRCWAGWKEGVTSAAFSPDGRSLMASLTGGTVFVWDATTGKARAKIAGRLCAVAPGGKVALAEEGLLLLWDVEGKEKQRLKLSRSPVARLVFSADGRSLMTASQDGLVRVWDPSTGKGRSRFEIPAQERDELLRAHLELSSDGRTLVSLRILSAREMDVAKFGNLLGYGTVSVWNARTGERLHRLANGQRIFRACRLSPDGRALATQDNRSFTIWEVVTGKERRRFPAPPALALAFSRDGKLFAAGGYDSKVRVWSVDTGKQLARFEGHDHDIIDVAFSPDGKRLASASGDGTGLVWDVSGLLKK